jgi:DNA-binding SARP family transcriptional activator
MSEVARARLLPVLRDRFERRLTVVRAGAGFGKSTLLAQARRENEIEQLGIDVSLRLGPADASADHLLRRLSEALELSVEAASVGDLLDAVWSRAPTSVCLVLDDAHKLGEHAPAWGLLRELLDALAGNGHLLISSRRPPPLPVARLLSTGEATVTDEAELLFDEDELRRFAEASGLAPDLAASLPGWPALATLTGTVGRGASMDYLWDEVLGRLEEHRRAALAALAPLGAIDDALVGTLGDPRLPTASSLVEGLPLVDEHDGVVVLHDLWTEALAGASIEIDPEVRRRAGDVLLDRQELGRAAEAYALADAGDRFEQLVRTFARRRAMSSDSVEIERVLGVLPPSMRATPSARYLEATRYWSADERVARALLAQVADEAAAAGDHELEVLARWRMVQHDDLEIAGEIEPSPTLEALAAAEVPLARAVLGFVESRRAQARGDVEEAIAHLRALDDFDDDQRASSLAICFIDLGRPEALRATLESVLADGLSDIYEAQAVWMQGMVDPDVAWPLARNLIETVRSRPISTQASLRSVLTTMALAAGDTEAARRLADDAARTSRNAPQLVGLFSEVAAALVALDDDEEAGRARLAEILAGTPLGRWPERPYLYALCALRALLPEGEALDACRFGPSLAVAVQAGAAVAALRAGDPTPASQLPWTMPALLRVHVPAPLLAELAIAAADVPGASAVLASLPHQRRWLTRVADRPGHPAEAAARRAAAQLPARPGYDLRIDVLGTFEVHRSDGVPVVGWDRRERVRQLLAYLLVHGEVQRSELAAALWPDLAPDQAANNLRVNLSHLIKALQPDRDATAPPWFVVVDGSRLSLATHGITVDRSCHDEEVAAAVRAEAAGLPTQALEHYRRAAELSRGPLLPGLDEPWIVFERIRLQSSAHAAVVRIGELTLARGEPEQAMHEASHALRLDPLSERAQRLFLRCHLAIGSLAAAREAAAQLRRILLEAGLTPEVETERLLERLRR